MNELRGGKFQPQVIFLHFSLMEIHCIVFFFSDSNTHHSSSSSSSFSFSGLFLLLENFSQKISMFKVFSSFHFILFYLLFFSVCFPILMYG